MIQMIIPCNDENIETVFEYIGEDYGKCLYIYIDLKLDNNKTSELSSDVLFISHKILLRRTEVYFLRE